MFKSNIGKVKVQVPEQGFSSLAVQGKQYIVESFFHIGNYLPGTAMLRQVIINYCLSDWLEEAKIHPKVDLQIEYVQAKGIIRNFVEYFSKILSPLFNLVTNQVANIQIPVQTNYR